MAAEKYRIAREDLPEQLQPLDGHKSVKKVIEYQSPYADYSILLSEHGKKQAIRAFYLRNLRDGWEWVDGTDDGQGFVLLKRRSD